MSLVQFNTAVPVYILDYLAIVFVIVIAIGVIYKLRLWSRTAPPGFFKDAREYLGSGKLTGLFTSEFVNRVVAQKKVITDSRARWITHFLVFWGFVGLAVATVWDDVFFRSGTLPPPFSLQNPGNIIGNVAGFMVIVGTTVMLGRYLFVQKYKNAGKSRADTFFFTTLYIAIISGFATEFARYFGAAVPSLYIYVIHIAIVGALFISAPFTHFFHAILTPFMGYVERIRLSIQARRGDTYLGDRFLTMTRTSELVKAGSVVATKPEWLASPPEKEDKLGDSK